MSALPIAANIPGVHTLCTLGDPESGATKEPPVQADKILKYNARLPRYTSYPTAAQFQAGVGHETAAGWLRALAPDAAISLYLHVPFCRSLCWYCGCNMRVVNRDGPLDAYCARLVREIATLAGQLPGRLQVGHLHWGGGTPTVLGPERLGRVMDALDGHFALRPDAEVAIEIDPRVLDAEMAQALGRLGFNRASIGIQDLNPEVQRAVNRLQSWEETQQAAALLAAAGVDRLNLDLIYGLPYQTPARVVATVAASLSLRPERVALFGYAHVPWMKQHQNLLDADALPGPRDRLQQYDAAAGYMTAQSYVAIGLDLFARAGSAFAATAAGGHLHRNFQGYTEDDCSILLGLGASSISDLGVGLMQNASDIRSYNTAVDAGQLPVVRGVARTADDRLRSDVIEQLMCNFQVDLATVCAGHGARPDGFASALAQLAPLQADGLVPREGWTIRVPEAARPIVRAVAACFDSYLRPGAEAHATAV